MLTKRRSRPGVTERLPKVSALTQILTMQSVSALSPQAAQLNVNI